MLEERLDQPAHQEVNPDLCVAMGAAVQAAIIAGADVGAVLVDITPHTLGIRCLDTVAGLDFPFRFAPILHRNTPLPASRSEVFHTVYDHQESVEIDVYQGESDDVRNDALRVGKQFHFVLINLDFAGAEVHADHQVADVEAELGRNFAGRDGVEPDAIASPFRRQRHRHGVDRGFAHR